MMSGGALYHGEVVHKRIRPVEHRLNYRVFSMALDVDRIAETTNGLKLFSLGRFNLFSLRHRDHGLRDGSSVSEFAWSEVRRAGVEQQVERITMLFYPRILGYAFNPLTVYFCVDAENRPVLMIYEVRNTFGQDLTYVLHAGNLVNGTARHGMAKLFYVSPFNKVEGDYLFHVTPPAAELTVGVALKLDGAATLRTHFRGSRDELTDKSLLRAFFRYPLMTVKIVAGIHWEAVKLWKKGMRLQPSPDHPPAPIVRDFEPLPSI
ncbi:DUF1365 domain-containing protein [Ahrensia sp. R2A130]|uniref:DUF1365 domain-containing protein n=1 Tax=Ahrensia sp. R2A130 TaxID=744979 RepID=UPI0001E0D0CD|nr:DUF1365 family protein [Ahrensia sp. R2A130]EFL90878.1 conserved hypothetical protein [Ahrensia sp. R2A130]